MLMSGEAIDAQTALQLGLANRVVDDALVFSEAHAMAKTLCAKSRTDNAAIKTAVHLGAGRPLAEAITAERPVALDQMASDDVQTGMTAFRSHTEPVFP
jgi:enoyl-CoA hydratase/carnithine racemase